ncbi:MAG: hypothetical protein N2441_10120, partial [Rhodocyclaceae bacterium]|nr:hypothetical protein [Rhodocyclaceae bacterium]
MTEVTREARWIHGLAGITLAGFGLAGVYFAGGDLTPGVWAWFVTLGLVVVFLPALRVGSALGRPLADLREVISATRQDGDLTR